MNDDDLLNQTLETGSGSDAAYLQRQRTQSPEQAVGSAPTTSSSGAEYRQWQIGPNDSFRPAGITCERLAPAVYGFEEDSYGLYIRKISVITDSLIALPDSASERVLEGMKVFWDREDKYREHRLLYKRGVLLWGPPGSGKTATLQLLTQELLGSKMQGIVVLCSSPRLTSVGLAALRRIEPTRRLICIFEDIDELIAQHGEHQILALLDGENQVENIVNVATTNYPERLGARIVNRPSRFDERIFVGMPSHEARSKYLGHVTTNINSQEFSRWVEETEGLSIAHLRELAAAVLCLGQDYEAVLKRLKTMRHKIRETDGIGLPVGFGG
jgi:hypothetical protein